MSIQQLSFQAQLAQAAYATLSAGMSTTRLEDALRALDDGFTATQALQFAAKHSVVLQYDDTSPQGNGTGLSLTVFKDNTTNQLTLAIRGTTDAADWQTGNISIVNGGAAYAQIAALYSWWRRAIAPTNEWVSQYAFYTTDQGDPNALAVTGGYLVRKPDELGTAEINMSADPDQRLDVTGHSLGGHLAMAFGAMFGASTASVTSFNSPGFWDNGINQAFFAQLGGVVPTQASIGAMTTNVIADEVRGAAAGSNLVAGLWSPPGTRIDIPIEDQQFTGEPAAPSSYNHSQMILADALAVYALFDRLSPGFSTTAFDGLLAAGSNKEFASLEGLVGGLRALLGLGSLSLPPGNDKREDLYQGIKTIADSTVFAALAGKVDFSLASAALAGTARTDFASLLVLSTLSPVALRAKPGSETEVEAVLANANNTSYIAWLADKALSAADRSAGKATYSDQWLADRAAMLDTLVLRNQQNVDAVVVAYNAASVQYADATSGLQFQIGASIPFVDMPQVRFGGNSDETLNGKSLGDRLYGGAGNDTLNGEGGNDHLEGNAGVDSLDGGEGFDTLVGGTGADVLIGGAGIDRLRGGLGADTYSFNAGWGTDTIEDVDGQGSIIVAGIGQLTGAGALKLADGVWQSPDKRVTYALDDVSRLLLITMRGATDSIVIKNWTSTNNLGITLASERTYPTTTVSLIGDFQKLVSNGFYERADRNYVSAGPEVNAQDLISGSESDDYLSGLGGNDGLAGTLGNDVLDGGDGDDLLLGGLGSDLVMGGAGSDFVFGAGWYFDSLPDRPSDPPLAAPGIELSRGFGWVTYSSDYFIWDGDLANTFSVSGAALDPVELDGDNVLDGGSGSDYLFGGDATDIVVGGSASDLLMGLAGDDTLVGGTGDDRMLGDGTLTPAWFFTTVAGSAHGRDLLLGGAGSDTLIGGGGEDRLFGGDDHDALYGDFEVDVGAEFHGADYLYGGAGDDLLYGGRADDVLDGGAGQDAVYGDAGQDTLISDGEDFLYGGAGNDTYLVRANAGSQASTISDAEGTNTIVFDGGVPGALKLFVESGRVFVASGGDTFVALDSGVDLAQLVLPADGNGVTATMQSLVAADNPYGLLRSRHWVAGTGPVDTGEASIAQSLLGSVRAELLEGGAADDIVTAGAGSDVVRGGTGNDLLAAGTTRAEDADTDADVFLFARGDGDDLITSNGGTPSDILRFGVGVQRSDLVVSRQTLTGANGLEPGLVIAYGSGDRIGITGLAEDTLARVEFADGSSVSTAELFAPLAARGTGSEASETIQGGNGTDVLRGVGGADKLFGNAGDDVLDGGAGNDELDGGAGNSVLVGGSGNDLITVQGGVNVIAGGTGNDNMRASAGTSTYYFGVGDGQDSIHEFNVDNRKDTLVLGPGITASNLTVQRVSTDLILGVAGTGDSLRVLSYFGANAAQDDPAKIGTVAFSDGTTWTGADLASQARPGRDANGTIVGTSASETLQGTAAVDYLAGLGGDDVLIGGGGNDRLDGGDGNDRYVLGTGTGADVVNDAVFSYGALNTANAIDTLEVQAAASQVALSRGGNNNASLFVKINGTTDQVEVAGWFDQDNSNTLRFTLSDGSVWDAAAIRAMATAPVANADAWIFGDPGANSLVGTNGANTISAGAGDDTLDGGAGNDLLYGGSGQDTYLFGYGSGDDKVIELDYTTQAQTTVDTVLMTAGVRPQDVTATRSGSGDVVLTLAGSDDRLTLQRHYGTDSRVEAVRFQDGTVWNLAASASGAINGTSLNDTLYGTADDETISGGAGNDFINGSLGNDIIVGGDGNDTLNGDNGADTLDGGPGADYLSGGDNDRLLFGRGDGADTVGTFGGVLAFKAGILPADLLLSSSEGGTLNVRIAGTSDSVQLISWLYPNSLTKVKRFEFANGAVWTEVDIQSKVATTGGGGVDSLHGSPLADVLVGLDGNDELWGYAGDDNLQGGNGNDKLYGGAGNDRLEGGSGADELIGDSGSDVYVLNAGFGQDTIIELYKVEDSSVDTVVFSAGITPSDVIVTGDDTANAYLMGNLYLTVAGTTDLVTLSRWLDPTRSNIDRVEFADGSVWTRADLLAQFYAAQGGGSVEGSRAADVLAGGATADQISGAEGDDQLSGMGGQDVLIGGTGGDTLDGGAGNDFLYGGLGNDTYLFGHGSGVDTIGDFDRVGWGRDRINMAEDVSPGDVTVSRSDVHLVLSPNGGVDQLQIIWYPNDGLKIEEVSFANGVIWTAAMLEAMAEQSITLAGTDGADTLIGTSRGDVLLGNGGDDLLIGGAGDDRLQGGSGNDRLEAGPGQDTLTGDSGDDAYVVSGSDDTVVELTGEGVDFVESEGSYRLPDNVENLTLRGTAVDAAGNALANVLRGNAVANTLSGEEGGDDLDGDTGNDLLMGGLGADTYRFNVGWGVDVVDDLGQTKLLGLTDDGALDEISFGAGVLASELAFRVSSADLVISSSGTPDAITVKGFMNAPSGLVERIRFADGTTLLYADIIQRASTLYGTDGPDTMDAIFSGGTLYGRGGSDDLRGGQSNDKLFGEDGDDTVSGNDGNDELYGGLGSDWLRGGWGNDLLDGGAGQDSLYGDVGDDTYVIDDAGDSAAENANGGTDTIQSSLSWTLGANFENLTLVGGSVANGTGNSLANVIIGNAAGNTLDGGAANDILDGGAGVDTLIGGAGNDIFLVDDVGDVTTEAASAGTDTVRASVSWTLGTNVENLELFGAEGINGRGNAVNNRLTGNNGQNTLDGEAGNDTMLGGFGDDTYFVDSTGDIVTESAGEGTDTVQAALTWTLGANLENLVLTGSAAVNGTGNGLVNTLTGNSGANVLNGGAGNDAMAGSAGNDTYVVDAIGDTVIEAASAGIDLVQSSITWTLGADLENLTLTGTAALNGTGNDLANVITGNAADNLLDGGLGNDRLVGGAGNDTFVVESSSDVVTEAASAGTDTVLSSVTLTLASNVENLTLTGASAINATGNSLNNVLRGNAGSNTLSGGTGSDSMLGGAGNDTYVVDASGDSVTELAGEGIDLVQASSTYTLAANVENLTLTATSAINGTGNALNNLLNGNSANNTLTGGDGNDVLDGGTGNDTMVGGVGDDVYKVNVTTDVVTEAASSGRDRIESSVTLTLASNVEDLTLLGSSAINGTGNTLDNVLAGNSAANSLTGGAGNDSLNGNAGADTMVGGAGNDVYFVDNTSDVTNEASNEGIDTVNSAVMRTLGSNLENLTLTGTAAINGTGNTLDNTLTGNSGANTLSGNAGNDTLDGGVGADTLIGGAGNDKYVMARGYGADLVQENDTTAGNTDLLQFMAGVATDQIWFRQIANDLEVSIIGTTDKATLQNWYLGNPYHVEQFKTSDGRTLLDSKVQDLVSAMASFTPPAAGQTTLPASYQSTLLPVIAANWGP